MHCLEDIDWFILSLISDIVFIYIYIEYIDLVSFMFSLLHILVVF